MNTKITLVASVVMGFAFSIACAAHSADLAVRGMIQPQACAPMLAGNGVVAFGEMSPQSLHAGEYTRLPARQIDFNISCSNATKVAVRLLDNRKSSAVPGMMKVVVSSNHADDYNFGLGSVAGKNVGGYVLSVSAESSADGRHMRTIASADGANWHHVGRYLRNDGVDYVSFADDGNGPIAFRQLKLTIDVDVMLNKPENLPLSHDVPLDGSATIEVVYL